jgi:CheY-like chemotaxis protein
MLSHELRNPLAAITAAAHVVRFAKPGSAEAISAQLVIERQTRHMARLIGDLLDVSRITLGKMALEREPVELADTVTKLVSSWRASGRFGRHEVTLHAAPARVHADGTRIEQIVANLLDNALKFTPHRQRVEITLAREGSEAVLRVSDSGPGIPPHLLDKLFEPFVQGNEPGTRASAGLGIGLALVKGLAEMHGGSVSAANAPSGGAVFTVRLPLLEASPLVVPSVERIATGGRHILLIEDDDDTRMMLHAALEFGGHEVREARDGKSGLALAAQALPDVAVIDLGLPDMDGFEVARRLRSTQGKRRLSLVALTGFGGPDDQRRALDAGFDVHLTKPVTHERLKRVIGAFK